MEYLTDDEKWLLAVFLKRLGFEAVYEVTDAGDKEARKDQAYRFLNVIGKVQKELSDMGFAPR